MWHEARKQERRIRGMIVDYRKRAERRQDFYERIQADPTQFIQIHGRRCKIHLDPAVAAAGDGAAIIVPWQGNQDNLIDRFDVRAHLDYIPPVSKTADGLTDESELSIEERQCNYERYRILAQNDFLSVPEEKFLHQLHLEEQFGANAQLEAIERNSNKKKQQRSAGATIGYSYEDSESVVGPQPFSHLLNVPAPVANVSAGGVGKPERRGSEGSESADSDMDMDVSIDVSKLDTAQAHELNACGRNYGMISNDFYSYLTKDADEADALRIAREEEQEKMLLSGRKSRRERRAQKERRVACRPFSPPSYAAKEDPDKKEKVEDESDSRSPSPSDANAGKITYITSFGGEDELQPHSKISINLTKGQPSAHDSSSGPAGQVSYAQKVKENLSKLKVMDETTKRSRRRSRSSSSGKSHERRRRSYSRSRSRSRERRRGRRRDRSSRSSSYGRSKRHRYRKSRSRGRYRRHYRSSTSHSSSSSSRGRSRGRKTYSSRRRSSRQHSRERSPSTRPSLSVAAVEKKTEPTTDIPITNYPLSTYAQKISEPILKSTKISSDVPVPQVIEPPPPPLKRYYGRKRGEDSSSDLASDTDDVDCDKPEDGNDSGECLDMDTTSEKSNPVTMSSTSGKQIGKNSTAQAKTQCYSNASETKVSSSSRLNLRERLKRKMQNLLNKQYKADKRAEIEKSERERQLQKEREEEMRELALKLRRRQRELRHRYGSVPSSGKDSESESVDLSKVNVKKRSESESSEQSIVVKSKPSRSKERELLESTDHQRTRRSRDRRRSRSRSRSPAPHRRVTRSRSRSRYRRSASRRNRRSNSRMRRYKDGSYDDRPTRRRSPYQSRERRHHYTDRDRDSYCSIRNRDRDRDRERERDRLRTRDRYQGGGSGAPNVPSTSSTSTNRSKIVISAPPKLKKLVDY